jgi:cis-3-alkyl-4-acyloxetan-2-one decarboxylase
VVTFEYPFAGNYLDLDGLQYHYVDEGHGEPLVMVHGNPSWSYLYRNLVRQLSPDYRCIVPDHIGCGRSDKPDDRAYDYTLSRRVADLDQLITHLELERVTLVLHDWGGMIGTAWAAQNPDRVARMVVMNTGAFHLPTSKSMPFTLNLARTPGLGALLVRGFSAFSRGANKHCVTRGPMRKEVAAGFLEPYDSWRNRIAVHRFVQDIPLRRSDRAFDVVAETESRLHTLRDTPKLLCWGMRDFVFDHHFLGVWIQHFPDAEVHRFEDAGHYVLEDAGDEIEPLIRAFLAKHETTAEAR